MNASNPVTRSAWKELVSPESDLSSRRVDKTLPCLIPFLSAGKKVLDVGCGPGVITIDVAAKNSSMKVFGVDAEVEMVHAAQNNARALSQSQVKFVHADAMALPFGDDWFDVTYSHALIDWVEEPEKVLKEKVRVTAPGGVVMLRIGDLASRVAYPRCPFSDRVISQMERLITESDGFCGWNPFMARYMKEMFGSLGMERIVITGWTDCHYKKTGLKPNLVLPGWPYKGVFGPIGRRMRMEGILDEQIDGCIQNELQAWCNDPAAFIMRSGVYAMGKVGQKE